MFTVLVELNGKYLDNSNTIYENNLHMIRFVTIANQLNNKSTYKMLQWNSRLSKNRYCTVSSMRMNRVEKTLKTVQRKRLTVKVLRLQ